MTKLSKNLQLLLRIDADFVCIVEEFVSLKELLDDFKRGEKI